MTKKIKQKNLIKSFYMQKDVNEKLNEFKNIVEFDFSDSKLINYLIKLGLKYIEENPKKAVKLF